MKFSEATTADDWVPSGNRHLTYQGNPYLQLDIGDYVLVGGARAAAYDPETRHLVFSIRDGKLPTNLPHETGHWLGLNHSGYQSSIMWKFTDQAGNKLLPKDVINTVNAYR